MKKLQILGTGCSKCIKLEQNAREAVKTLGLDYEVEKISDIQEIMKFGIMMTPGLAIDGKVVTSGRLLNSREIESILTSNEDN
jgi:small redox-active disulfide protein 2